MSTLMDANLFTIGGRLKAERERLSLAQPAFALVADAGKRTLIDWEKGVSSPNAAQLARLSAIGVDVLYVVTGERAGGVKPAPALTAEEETLLEQFRAAPVAVRRAAMGALYGAMAPLPTQTMGNMTNNAPGGVQVGSAGGSVTVRQSGKKSRRRGVS